jgi:hypothetical protein
MFRLAQYKPSKERTTMRDPNAMLEPGMLVRHPAKADWGLGQVQSNIGGRVTVNFEHAGKVVFAGGHVALIPVFDHGSTIG